MPRVPRPEPALASLLAKPRVYDAHPFSILTLLLMLPPRALPFALQIKRVGPLGVLPVLRLVLLTTVPLLGATLASLFPQVHVGPVIL